MTVQPMPETEAQLLIIAENLLSRAGLSALLQDRGYIVLAQVDGVELQRDIDRLAPDLLVVDLGWDGETMRQRLIQIDRDLPVLALIAADDDEALSPLLQELRLLPQFALLLRDSEPDSVVAALVALEGGLTVIDPRLSGLLRASVPDQHSPSLNPLTARELEVLQLLARGLTNRAIALELGITQHTIKFHVNAIMSKLEVQSRTEAVVRATQLGMIVL